MNIKQEEEFQIKQEELIIKDEYMSDPEPGCTSGDQTITKHLTVPCDEKSLHCKHCDYKTSHKGSLNRHMLVHSTEKPHHCVHCDFKTTHRVSLKRHLLSHTGIALECKHCEFETYLKSSLNRHLLVHKREKRFQCKYCDYRTSSKYQLKQHLLSHEVNSIGERQLHPNELGSIIMINAEKFLPNKEMCTFNSIEFVIKDEPTHEVDACNHEK